MQRNNRMKSEVSLPLAIAAWVFILYSKEEEKLARYVV